MAQLGWVRCPVCSRVVPAVLSTSRVGLHWREPSRKCEGSHHIVAPEAIKKSRMEIK